MTTQTLHSHHLARQRTALGLAGAALAATAAYGALTSASDEGLPSAPDLDLSGAVDRPVARDSQDGLVGAGVPRPHSDGRYSRTPPAPTDEQRHSKLFQLR